jgi:hypothetical protein
MKLWRFRPDLNKAGNFSEPKINALIPLSQSFGHAAFLPILPPPPPPPFLTRAVSTFLPLSCRSRNLATFMLFTEYWWASCRGVNVLQRKEVRKIAWTQPVRQPPSAILYQKTERRRISDVWKQIFIRKECNYTRGNIILKNNIRYVHDANTPIKGKAIPVTPVKQTETNDRGDPLRWPRNTLYRQKLALLRQQAAVARSA